MKLNRKTVCYHFLIQATGNPKLHSKQWQKSPKPDQVHRHLQNGKTGLNSSWARCKYIHFFNSQKSKKKDSLCHLAMCKILWKAHSCWMDQIISKTEHLPQWIIYIWTKWRHTVLLYRCCSFTVTGYSVL